MLAFVGQTTPASPRQLFVRRLSEMQATPLAGTENAANPFFSPDGQWVAFFDAAKLKKVAVTGGAVVTITDAPNSRGGAWSDDGTIVFAENRSGLFRVPSSGGAREPLTTLATGEVTHRFPQILPGGRAVLYTAHTAPDNFDDATIVVQPLPSGTPTIVHRGGYYGRYLPSGHVAYIHKGTLFATPLDLDRLEVTGPSVPVIENVTANPSRGEAQFAFSNSGTLVYLASRGSDNGLPLLWFDRQGRTETLRSTPARFRAHRIAPDGQRIAMDLFDGTQADVWIYDFSRDTLSRVTFDPAFDSDPVWTPDGRRIVFASDRGARGTAPTLYWQRVDGTGEAQRLVETKGHRHPVFVAPEWPVPSLSGRRWRRQRWRTRSERYQLDDSADGRKRGDRMETRVADLVSQYAVAGIRADVFSRWPMGRLLVGRDRGRDKCSCGPFPVQATVAGVNSRWQRSCLVARASGAPVPRRRRHPHDGSLCRERQVRSDPRNRAPGWKARAPRV